MNVSGLKMITLLGLLIVLHPNVATGKDNPWAALQDRYRPEHAGTVENKPQSHGDPWQRLRTVVLTFSATLDEDAATNPAAAEKVAGKLHQALRPYEKTIREAAERFGIPEAVIGAVIMVESGGNRLARARTSSAKGLMQTIDGTFREARKNLLAQQVYIEDDPFDPHASIMAGSWYLGRMYEAAAADCPGESAERKYIRCWRRPLEYYYAGPGNGKKREDIVIVYSGGRRVVIDKPGYSGKVLRWAEMMNG